MIEQRRQLLVRHNQMLLLIVHDSVVLRFARHDPLRMQGRTFSRQTLLQGSARVNQGARTMFGTRRHT